MTQAIERGALRAFFLPYAEQAHRASERVHIIHARGLSRHGAGYVCEVNEAAVAKYSDGSNSTTWIAFAEIVALEVCDINGRCFRAFTVTDGGAA